MKGKIGSIVALLAILMLSVASACCLTSWDITDIAVAPDGTTIYVIGDNALHKSTDGGSTFAQLTMPPDFDSPPRAVAVAPDDPSTVAASDSATNEAVWVSADGGVTWASLDSPCAGGDTITDLAISPAIPGMILGRYFFATIADNASGAVALGNVRVIGDTATWTSVGGVTGTHDYMAIQVSPGFASDRCICVVGAKVAAGVDYQIISTVNAGSVIRTVQFVAAGTTTDFKSPAAYNSIIFADIALPNDFDPTTSTHERAFIGIASFTVQPTDDVYRVDHTIAADLNVPPGTDLCIRSIDYAGTIASGKLITGEQATTMVWHTTNPASVSPTWTTASTPPTGTRDTVVGMHPDVLTNQICYAGTSGCNSGFFISTDNSDTFTPAPRAIIILQQSPLYDERFVQGEAVRFEAAVICQVPCDGSQLQWTSDLDGYLGDGTLITTSSLSVGGHTITVSGYGGSQTFPVRVFADLGDLYRAPLAEGEIQRILSDFTFVWENGSGVDEDWAPYDSFNFDQNSTDPSKVVIIAKLDVMRHQRFSEPLPMTNGETIYDHLRTYVHTIQLRLDCGGAWGGSGWMGFSRSVSVWDGRRGGTATEPDACKTPLTPLELWPYIYQLQLFVHEGRHSEPGDPSHTNCGQGGPLSKDEQLEGGSGYAWAALYKMWVYKYSLYDPPDIRDKAGQAAASFLSTRFCTTPSHSDPQVQAIIDELLP